jgi:hypothetical protein
VPRDCKGWPQSAQVGCSPVGQSAQSLVALFQGHIFQHAGTHPVQPSIEFLLHLAQGGFGVL